MPLLAKYNLRGADVIAGADWQGTGTGPSTWHWADDEIKVPDWYQPYRKGAYNYREALGFIKKGTGKIKKLISSPWKNRPREVKAPPQELLRTL